MFTGLASLASKLRFLANENSTTILTGMGVTGTVATAYLTGRATFKAARIIAEEEYSKDPQLFNPEAQAARARLLGKYLDKKEAPKEVVEELARISEIRLSPKDKAKLVWHLYILPAGTGLVTVASIITAHKISSKKIAALVVASGVSERALQEYKSKVIEKLGDKQDQKLRDDIAQDRVSNNPVGPQEVILTGEGKVLCYDMFLGRYFQSTAEDIKRAENKINYELVNHMYASATEFYEEIGLPPTTFTDSTGWNSNERCEVIFSTTLSSDDRPCLAIDFKNPPFLDYDRHHG